jgi:hypothetical protein
VNQKHKAYKNIHLMVYNFEDDVKLCKEIKNLKEGSTSVVFKQIKEDHFITDGK